MLNRGSTHGGGIPSKFPLLADRRIRPIGPRWGKQKQKCTSTWLSVCFATVHQVWLEINITGLRYCSSQVCCNIINLQHELRRQQPLLSSTDRVRPSSIPSRGYQWAEIRLESVARKLHECAGSCLICLINPRPYALQSIGRSCV